MVDERIGQLPDTAEPIARRVLIALRRAIVTMQLAPGEMLSEQDLAQRFGVSRSPVREAFIQLSRSGLVRVLPQRGTQVVKISRAMVEDARFVREAVECAVVAELAARVTPLALAKLTDSIERQRKVLDEASGANFLALDEAFHRLLADAAGRPAAWEMIEDVKPQMDRVRYLDMSQPTPRRLVFDQHVAIVDAVRARDAAAAREAMRSHLSEILHSLPIMAASYPDLFEPVPDAPPVMQSA